MLRIRSLISAFTIAAAAMMYAAAPLSASEHGKFSPAEEKEVQRILREYLLSNPEIVLEAIEKLRRREKFSEAQRVQKELRARRDEIYNDPSSPVGWNADGDVTVVEFFDYRCPYCRAMMPRLAKLKESDRKIRYVYKEWPILGPVSRVAARAALASTKQGKYEEFHDALMTFAGNLRQKDIFTTAAKVGLDVERLREDMKAPEITAGIARTSELAKALGIRGTPAFVIGDVLAPGAVTLRDLKKLIEQARKPG